MSTPPQQLPNGALIAKQAEMCFELKAKGWSLRRIGVEVGIAPNTVRKRIEDECARRISPRVEELRTIMDCTLDAAQATANEIMATASDAELQLKAMDRLVRIMERRARLHGIDAPVRVDAVVTQQTQTEAELESLFADLDARNAAAKEAIEAGQ